MSVHPAALQCLACSSVVPWERWDFLGKTVNLATGDTWLTCPECGERISEWRQIWETETRNE